MNDNREQLTQQIIDAGRFLYGRGWSPATSSNYSARLDEQRALLTVSGKHKGQLGFDDVLATDLAGNSLEPGKKPRRRPSCTPSCMPGTRRSARCCIPTR